MNGYLFAEEGPLAGITVAFEEGVDDQEWLLGRDPDSVDVVLEDPMVSRQHVIIRSTPGGLVLENLSTVNPATQNGMVIADPIFLKEGDIIQIGSTFFCFTVNMPVGEESKIPLAPRPVAESRTPSIPPDPDEEGGEMSSELHFGPSTDTRWLLKVISGPNSGAEFAMKKGTTYLIGKDANVCDVVFQDLSVSRQHANLSIDGEENAFIEDLASRNGVIVNGELISEKHSLSSQDLVALGTTTFLVIDRREPRETIISPAVEMPKLPKTTPSEEAAASAKMQKDWKELIIPKRHLLLAGVFGGVLLISLFGMLSLFRSEAVVVKQIDETRKIGDVLNKFEAVTFSFTPRSGKLFLTGHVLTTIEYQEMLYLLREVPFIRDMEDSVIVDELVWQSMNALLCRNPDWVSVSMYSPSAGRFALRGYVETLQEAEELQDYVNRNFDYLNRLENQVVIEKNLRTEMQSMLIEKGFTSVSFQLSNGELVFSGRIDEKEEQKFHNLIDSFKKLPGIRVLKNFVVTAIGPSSRVNLTSEYKITGFSKRDDKDIFVLINGRILGQGDIFNGMKITSVEPKMVLLEKEGFKYRIKYNTH
jgi:type III secretion system YscD/HrpQ family protein